MIFRRNETEQSLKMIKLSCAYQKSPVLLSDINLEIKPSKLICLLGPNGSGKTTLLKTISGLIPPFEGDIIINGENLNRCTDQFRSRYFSTVFARSEGSNWLKVWEFIHTGRYPHTGWLGSLKSPDYHVIDHYVKECGVYHLLNKPMGELSDGERQRVHVTRALVQDPKLLLLDEPTAFLDLPSRIELLWMLRKLAHLTQKAMIVSTHELSLALQVADEIWVIDQGKLIQALPEELVINGVFGKIFSREEIIFDNTKGTFDFQHHWKIQFKVEGPELLKYWTEHFLRRLECQPVDEAEMIIETVLSGDKVIWELSDKTKNEMASFYKLSDLENHIKSNFLGTSDGNIESRQARIL